MSVANPGEMAGWFWVCVEERAGEAFRGTMQNPYQPEPVAFDSLDHFLQLAEEEMEEDGFPQGFVQMRRFEYHGKRRGLRPPRRTKPPELMARRQAAERAFHEPDVKGGRLGVFEIKIICRHHAAWQGNALFFDPGDKIAESLTFRSALELVMAMRRTLLGLDRAGGRDPGDAEGGGAET